MAKSEAHKYFNKFTGWARREGMVKAEEFEAMDEFFVDPRRLPEDPQEREILGKLELDWFLLKRPLKRAGVTPFGLFRRPRTGTSGKAASASSG